MTRRKAQTSASRTAPLGGAAGAAEGSGAASGAKVAVAAMPGRIAEAAPDDSPIVPPGRRLSGQAGLVPPLRARRLGLEEPRDRRHPPQRPPLRVPRQRDDG